ncbi:MAG TPA: M23 family metallopeptidase [Verrucomicrobiae bacterium]|nr:M23 family metallopeptidase [Verrucomicrobiae bacterium]
MRGTSQDLIWWDIFADYRQHTGVDISAPVGTRIVAANAGTVTELGQDPVYGKVVVLEHGSGWQTVYGELQNIKVKLNQQVKLGQELGQVGESSGGEADLESHLHYEIRQNEQILNGKE